MTELIKFLKPCDLNNYTLIIPSVAVGNVGQLSIDLLISTLNLEKAATIWHPGIIPAIGADPFLKDSSEICTACELYISEKLRIAVIQIRSSVEQEFASSFFNELKTTIIQQNIKNVVLLTSSFDHEMHNISSGKYRYITNEENDKLIKLGVLPMDKEEGRYKIFGGGYALLLFDTLGNDVKCTIIVKYSSEGDNRPDAISMVELLYNYLENFSNETIANLKCPFSWDYVFGNPPPEGIY